MNKLIQTETKEISILLLILLAFVSTCHADTTGYHFRIRFASTSDWATLEFLDATAPVALDIDVVADSSEDGANIGVFYITRSDTAPVIVDYDCFLSAIPETGLVFNSQKGDWGNVHITFSNLNPEMPPYPSMEFENNGSIPDDPTNLRTFVVPHDFLTEGGPIVLPTDPWTTDRLILAFYYPWYGSPSGPTGYWCHWDPDNHYASTHEPLLGYYDSYSPEVVSQHISWAKESGIDGFICSWWGPGSFTDGALDVIFSVADTSDFLISFYIETCGIETLPESERLHQFIHHFNYLLANYRLHPAMFRIDGVPTLFLYGYPLSLMPLDSWALLRDSLDYDVYIIVDRLSPLVLDLFDGYHTYNPCRIPAAELAAKYNSASLAARYQHKLFAATILPGYCDTIIRDPGLTVDREDGAFYSSRFEIAAASEPNFILITSWNEWHEGTEIEPSVEYSYQYLDSTRSFHDRWDIPGSIEQKAPEMPTSPEIHIYPNPFNSSCIITVGDRCIHPATAEIYNLQGRLVAKGLPQADTYKIVWIPDEKICSGVYLIRVQTKGGRTTTKKVVYLK